jgi:hypothetical protein
MPASDETSQACWVLRFPVSGQSVVSQRELNLGSPLIFAQHTSDFTHSRNSAVNQVPLCRYFAFVGGLLLGMLFIADWYFPSASSQTFREASFDRSIIRVKSAHKWPEPITIDTSLPTIVPPLPVLARATATNQPREAFAELTPPSPKASEYPGTIRAKHKVAARVRPKRIADYRAIPETLPSGWLPRL